MSISRIGLASDHAGYQLKSYLIEGLRVHGYETVDFGTTSEASVDYPDFAHMLARAVVNGEVDCGVALCGSGNGIGMSLNRHAHVRAALCWHVELAYLARAHNDANVLVLPARFVTPSVADSILYAFLTAQYEGGRHQRRVEKIDSCALMD